MTHSDNEGLQRFSILIIGVDPQQVPSLLTLVIETLKTTTTTTVQYQTLKRIPTAAALSYVDAEVSRGAAQRPAWCQRSGDVLQGEGGGEDPHGEADHQESSGASEGPAVSWMDVRLQEVTDNGSHGFH